MQSFASDVDMEDLGLSTYTSPSDMPTFSDQQGTEQKGGPDDKPEIAPVEVKGPMLPGAL